MIRWTPISTPSNWRIFAVSSGAVIFAAFLIGFLFLAYGVSPAKAYSTMLSGTLADWKGWAEVMRRTIPLLLIGAGLALAFRAQFFNIGAEGQLIMGAIGAGGVALFTDLPAFVAIPSMFVVGALAGGLWAWISAILRQKLSVNEILSTLMLNYIAAFFLLFLVGGPWKGKDVRGFIYSDEFGAHERLPTITGTLVHWPTLVLGIIIALALQFLLNRSTLGYALRVVGENVQAARYAGISVSSVTIMVALITGGAAGLAGAGEVAGIHHRLIEPSQISLGYGFTAVIVAWLARGNPALCLATAPLMAIVLAGGDILKISMNMPFRIVDVFSGVILICLIASEFFIRNNPTWRTKWTKS